jgi:CPA1 family monovalent cation:H+ antiporter
MYDFAEHFHYSGVLAVVSGGLFLSNRRLKMLTYQSRIQGVNVWTNIVFVLNGLIFLLIGLQLPAITQQLGDVGLAKAIWYGLVISFALIFTRLLCTLLGSPFTWLMSHFIKVADPTIQWKMPVIFGWAGMRGVVSLAAALSIPLLAAEGHPFPFRNLILFITFIVILITLVFQGLTLPWLIRKVNPEDKLVSLSEHEQEIIIQKKITERSILFLEEKYGERLSENEQAYNLYSKLKIDLSFFNPEAAVINDRKKIFLKNYQHVYLELLEQQRNLLNEMNHSPEFDEELIRKYLSLVDLEELKLREKLLENAAQGKTIVSGNTEARQQ